LDLRTALTAGPFHQSKQSSRLVNESLPRRFRFRYAILLAGLIFTGDLLGILLLPPGRPRVVIIDIVNPIEDILAATCLIFAARASNRISSRLGWVWGAFAGALACLAAGDILWGVLEVGFNHSPLGSAVNLLYLAAYPLLLFGAFMLPGQRLTRSEWLKRWLDIGIVILTTSLIFWNYLLGPLSTTGTNETWIFQLVSLVYPVGDMILLWVLIVLLYRQAAGNNPTPLLILGLAALSMIVTHLIFTYQTVSGTYVSGSILDLGWPTTCILAGLAATLQIKLVDQKRETDPAEIERLTRWVPRSKIATLFSFLSYLWILIAYLLLIVNYRSGFPMDFPALSVAVGIIIGMVVIRQMIVLQDNYNLNKELNLALKRMSHQTSQLQAEITERERAEERLLHDATYDALTGLPNRVLFMDRLERAIAYTRNRPDYHFSVLFLDADQFKVINDSLGHSFGDQVLITVANRLKACLRTGDTVARLGGDEFVILLEGNQGLEPIKAAAVRIQDEIRIPVALNEQQVYVTASIGIVPSIAGYLNPQDVLRDADIAMYRAKALGKDRYEVFDPNLRIQAISRLELENDLRRALEGHEFALLYQPILDLATDRVVGFETLIRWHHPQRGTISPTEFIPVAEETGMIVNLGQWVLQQACVQIKTWQTRFPRLQPLHISVNISGKQFILPDFTGQIEQALSSSGLSPASLMLEITETVFINNAPTASLIFNQLCDMGVQLQIDDFGTGYSSLSYLQHFPIHTIKIDQSFIQGMGVSYKNSELVHTILTMAHDLGMEAIAEGIETDSQLQELRSYGCKFGQGYLLSRPMGTGAVEEWLAHRGEFQPARAD
jgi:diguanylate cyclase (GGDEF)-like protein